MRALGFLIDGELFAVDVAFIQKVERRIAIMPVPAASDSVAGITNMKGRVITVLKLPALLGRAPDNGGDNALKSVANNATYNIVNNATYNAVRDAANNAANNAANALIFKVLTGGSDQIGMLIDTPCDLVIFDERLILPLPLETNAREKKFISGVANVDGKLYRIINVFSIINQFQEDDMINRFQEDESINQLQKGDFISQLQEDESINQFQKGDIINQLQEDESINQLQKGDIINQLHEGGTLN